MTTLDDVKNKHINYQVDDKILITWRIVKIYQMKKQEPN
jgi:hypothetical protein